MSCYPQNDIAQDVGGNPINGTAIASLNDFGCKVNEIFNFTADSSGSLCSFSEGFLWATCESTVVVVPQFALYYTGKVETLTLDCANDVKVNGVNKGFDKNPETAAKFDELFASAEFKNLGVEKLTIQDCLLNSYPDLSDLDELKIFTAASNSGIRDPPQIPLSANATECDFKLALQDSLECQNLTGSLAIYNSSCGNHVTLKNQAFDDGCCQPIEHSAEGARIVCTSVSKFVDGFPNCTTSYFLKSGVSDVCEECTAINNSVGILTCTSESDSQTTACSPSFYRKAGPADSGEGCTPIGGSTGELSCTDADNSRTTACAAGKYLVKGALNDTCAGCTAVEGATSLTCTNASDSRAAGCMPPKIKMSGEMADTCVDACGQGMYNNSGTCAMCTPIQGSNGTISCSTNIDSTTTACASGRYKMAGSADTCPECTPIANKAAAASVTCTSASDSKLDGNCATSYTKVQGNNDTCIEEETSAASTISMSALIFMAVSFF